MAKKNVFDGPNSINAPAKANERTNAAMSTSERSVDIKR